MVVILVIWGCLCAVLVIRYIGMVLTVRSLNMQLEEIDRGSRMELGVQSRQRDVLALCGNLNRIWQHWYKNRMQYEKAQKQLKQNITSLAHDIRTPLTGAAGYVQLAQECKEAARRERYLQTADDRLKELGDMLEEMFLYTKLTSREFELNLSDIQLLPLLSDCLLGFYRQFEERGISPTVEFETESLRVRADEECLRRIFHNLIQNALLHGRGGLAIRQRGTGLVFENLVSETSKPDPGQVFDQFYKADSARRKGSSGLGLFIVKELAEKMDMRVSAGMEGEKFWVALEKRVVALSRK